VFRTLYSKMALTLLGLFLLVGASFIGLSLYTTEMYQQEVNQKLNRELARLVVEDQRIMVDGRVNEASLKETFHMLMVMNPSIEIYLLDPEGHILAFSAEPGRVKRNRVDLSAVRKFLTGAEAFPLEGDDPRDPEGKKVFTAARIPDQGPLQGYLYVILGGEIYDNLTQRLQGSYIFRLSLWSVVTSLLVAVLTGLILFASLTRRLRSLARTMEAYTGGKGLEWLDLPPVRDVDKADEIDRLILAFNQMAGRIEDQVQSVHQADALRRELVAGVSHDLRTPLATLQGYVETLRMKDAALNDMERRNYLDIALSHCKRLSQLVADLFELAKLEARDIGIRTEPFNLAELTYDVTQKFQLRAADRKVRLSIEVPEETPLVVADIALIERVLENLLDNALRHTPEHGTVQIELVPSENRLEAVVRDTGPGIPEEELPLIFNRFYQLHGDTDSASGHSGLGLAITKHILELHESRIHVESRPGSGTAFSFDLPLQRPRS